ILTFTFDKLAPAKQEKEGIVVDLQVCKVKGELWTVGFRLQYPLTIDFGSHEAWVVNNEMALTKSDGKKSMAPNAGFDVAEQTANSAVVHYRFEENDDVKLGKPEDWKLTYRTPGTIVKVPVKFEFKDLELP